MTMRDPATRAPRPRLLPDDPETGWTPYLWLAYATFFFITPFNGMPGSPDMGLTLLVMAVFLPLYFRAHWARGRELYVLIAALAALGFGLLWTNSGATVFITYAASFASRAPTRRTAVAIVALLCAGVVLAGALGALPHWFWAFEVLIAATIGATNIHFEEVRKTGRALVRAREEVEHLARVAERERIARDLHDVLGHTLTLITLKSALAARLAERDPASASREMREVERVSREALADVRAAVAGQRQVGLAGELASAKDMLGAAGIVVEHAASHLPLTAPEESMLALAMREAVTNVVRHSRATSCRITLSHDGERRYLLVEDDGMGKRGPDGNGLGGMRERVRSLGGQLDVGNGAQGGTRVQVMLPGAAS